jgi:hypothetical protein
LSRTSTRTSSRWACVRRATRSAAPQHRPCPAAGLTFAGTQRWGAWELSGNVELLDAKDSDTGYRLNRRAAHQESVTLSWADDAWSAGAAFFLRRLASRRLARHDLRARRLWRARPARRRRFTPQWRLEAKLLNAPHRIERCATTGASVAGVDRRPLRRPGLVASALQIRRALVPTALVAVGACGLGVLAA